MMGRQDRDLSDFVHGEVVRAAAVHVPIKKIPARIMRERVVIEEIDHGHLASRDRETRDILLAAELVGAVLYNLLHAAQTERLPQVDARHIETRHREIGLLRLAVGKTSDTKGVAETKPLHQFRI